MKKHTAWIVGLLFIILTACGSKAEQPKTAVPQPIEAKLLIPEQTKVNEAVTISTQISQNGKPVDDADEVKYEIWKNEEKEKSEMIDAKKTEKGIYAINKAFSEDGVYYVQVHVTARGMHTMPKSTITVGNATLPADVQKDKKK